MYASNPASRSRHFSHTSRCFSTARFRNAWHRSARRSRGNGRRVCRRATSEHRGTRPASPRGVCRWCCRSPGSEGLTVHSSLELLLRLSRVALSGGTRYRAPGMTPIWDNASGTQMNRDRRKETRRKSMQGTLLFALGIIAAVLSLIVGSAWIAGAATALLIPAVIILYQVGKSLS